jgi:hypothetical protein
MDSDAAGARARAGSLSGMAASGNDRLKFRVALALRWNHGGRPRAGPVPLSELQLPGPIAAPRPAGLRLPHCQWQWQPQVAVGPGPARGSQRPKHGAANGSCGAA